MGYYLTHEGIPKKSLISSVSHGKPNVAQLFMSEITRWVKSLSCHVSSVVKNRSSLRLVRALDGSLTEKPNKESWQRECRQLSTGCGSIFMFSLRNSVGVQTISQDSNWL